MIENSQEQKREDKAFDESRYIEFKNVTKKFKKATALDNISFSIPRGKIFGIIGENGSGKTSLLNTLIGFYKPNKGTILYEGIDIFKELKNVEAHFGFATQINAFYKHLTVEENLYYFSRLYNIPKKEIREKIKKILDLVELASVKHFLGTELSTGMQRRLDIACSLLHKPDVLLLDEPTEDLDPLLRREILNLIKRINKEEHTTIIIASHLLEEVEELCNIVAILRKGKIIKIGSPEELENEYTKNIIVTFELLSKRYDNFLKKLKSRVKISYIDYEGNKVILHSPEGLKLLNLIIALAKREKEKIEFISLDKPSLDLIFDVIITGDHKI